MIPAAFAYARPTTVDEALQAVASGGEDVKLLAGGQSLIPVMRLRLAAPETVAFCPAAPPIGYLFADRRCALMRSTSLHRSAGRFL